MSVPNFNRAKTFLGSAINIAPFLQQIGFDGAPPPANILGFFGGKKKHEVFSPTADR
jgi:hypothetical protein